MLLVSPNEARQLLLQGYTYVDVRSEPEFALGRPAVSRDVAFGAVMVDAGVVDVGLVAAPSFKDAIPRASAARHVLDAELARQVVWNVPWQCVNGDRLVHNPDFVPVMQTAFRSDSPLIIGCRSGSRSSAASAALQALGFTRLAQLRHGFEGARDAFGRLLPGWRQSGLEIETGEPPLERSYAGLRARWSEHGGASTRRSAPSS
ncbi:MAG: hypothetical protein RL685_5574 [Pseudomonadota bacterium]